MYNPVLLYLGAGLTGLWGIAHLFSTKGVVRDFGDISADNRRIITMEWNVVPAHLHGFRGPDPARRIALTRKGVKINEQPVV